MPYRVKRSPSGFPVLFHGWLDNIGQLQKDLGTRSTDPGELFGYAVERWGRSADSHLIGTYAALVCLPDGTIRLSRSPWESFPLFVYRDDDVVIVSSLTRPIFATGAMKRLRMDAVDKMLCMELPADTDSMFEGIEEIPHGSIATISRGTMQIDRWYDPTDIKPVSFPTDKDYVEAANEILADAVSAALRNCDNPGVALSGGLDSPIVCDEILRQLPDGKTLPSFTFRPLPDWDGRVEPGGFGDDWPLVQEFARQHPMLDPIAIDNGGIAFDDRAEQFFLACEDGHPSRVLGSVYHGIFDAARENGCDWVLFSSFGNATYSSAAPWAATEFLRKGAFGQLWQLLNNGAGRPLRRFIGESVMPQLPRPIQSAYQGLRESFRPVQRITNPYLAADGRLGAFRNGRNIKNSITTGGLLKTREDAIRRSYFGAGLGAHFILGYEQVFGVRRRDVTAYRPLIEFCNAIPTEQYVRDGETRHLARRMAVGRMPEAQRTNTLYGHHNIDWHARLTPRREELRKQIEEVSRHPDIGPLIDTDLMLKSIDEWPEQTPLDPQLAAQYRFFLPAVLYVTKYVDAMTGRNR
ncbi:MAG: hypothetical protein KUG65_13335 [Sphingomonadaceae bacterium]|nr:hypothetical protein [Sphingomonadaceae bacterium]